MKFKVILLLLCITICSIFSVSAHWADGIMEKFKNAYIIHGDENGNLLPDNFITRAETAKILSTFLYGLMILDTDGKQVYSFTDVNEGDWYYYSVGNLVLNEIMTGKSDTKFGVEDLVTREEAATIYYRIFQTSLPDRSISNSFSDDNDISSLAKEAVNILSENKIIQGYTDNSFRPKGNITRAEFLVILDKIYAEREISQPISIANVDKNNSTWKQEDIKNVIIGKGKSVMMKFDLPADIPYENVRDAYIYWMAIKADNMVGNDVPDFDVYPLKNEWISLEATWNDVNIYYNDKIYSENHTGFTYTNITPIVKKWLCGEMDNNGVILSTEDIGNIYFRTQYYNEIQNASHFYPCLRISYTPNYVD